MGRRRKGSGNDSNSASVGLGLDKSAASADSNGIGSHGTDAYPSPPAGSPPSNFSTPGRFRKHATAGAPPVASSSAKVSERAISRLLNRYDDLVASGLLIIGSGESKLTDEDGGLMLRVLAGHKEFTEAAARTESVWVKLTDQGCCFVLRTDDGRSTDFCWRRCTGQGHSGEDDMFLVPQSQPQAPQSPQPAGTSDDSGKAGWEIMNLVRPREGSSPAISHAVDPLKLSTDEFMLTQIEASEDKVKDADRHNFDTFGEDALPGGGAWGFEMMMEANASLRSGQGLQTEAVDDLGGNEPIVRPRLEEAVLGYSPDRVDASAAEASLICYPSTGNVWEESGKGADVKKKCFFCKEPGHFKKECAKYLAGLAQPKHEFAGLPQWQ